MLLEDKDRAAQLNAWSMYRKASIEARVMNQLSHKNILGLLGIYFQDKEQICMLIELAPKGDLKSVVREFKAERMRLSRRTIKATLIQVHVVDVYFGMCGSQYTCSRSYVIKMS